MADCEDRGHRYEDGECIECGMSPLAAEIGALREELAAARKGHGDVRRELEAELAGARLEIASLRDAVLKTAKPTVDVLSAIIAHTGSKPSCTGDYGGFRCRGNAEHEGAHFYLDERNALLWVDVDGLCEARGYHVFSATRIGSGCKDCGISRDHDDHHDAVESTTLQLATRGWEHALRLAEAETNNAKVESLRYQSVLRQLEDENDALKQEVARLRAFIARIPTTSYPEQRCNNCGAVGSVPRDKCGACGKELGL